MCAIISPYCNEDKSSVFGINESVLFISILSALLLCLIFYHVVLALSDLLLCHVFVLRCTGHQIWLVLAMDIFVLCFLATIVFTSIHVVGLENYMVKMESIFFIYGFVFNIMECRGKLFELIIGILLRNVFWEFF